MPSVPEINNEAFRYLYGIEVGLREFILDSLQSIGEPNWYKKYLPGNAQQNFKRGVEYERGLKWAQWIPHHPIYYIDFPDLKEIITRKDNWNNIFKSIFNRKDFLVVYLSELEPVRNKIAHNRKLHNAELDMVKSTYLKLSTAIGPERFTELGQRCTYSLDFEKHMQTLQQEFEETYVQCLKSTVIDNLSVWEFVSNQWWFNGYYLDCDVAGITTYFQKIEEYVKLPRYRGTGHKIEAWVKVQDIEILYENAQKEFKAIIASKGE